MEVCNNNHIMIVVRHFLRLVADILNDVALFLELLAPLFPFMFMMIICAASAAKVTPII